LRRRVEFFAQLTTTQDDAQRFVVRENKSSGFGRLFKQARWHAIDDRNLAVVFSDGAEQWSATMRDAGKSLQGTATYSGDADHPELRWTATGTRYACQR